MTRDFLKGMFSRTTNVVKTIQQKMSQARTSMHSGNNLVDLRKENPKLEETKLIKQSNI